MRSLALAVLAAAACGNSPDAPDAGYLDANLGTRGPVTVRVIDKAGRPLDGIHVVFVDVDSTVTYVTTDATGMVSADLYFGASVTALRARDSGLSYALTTIEYLTPGDTITLITAPGNVSSVEDPFSQRVVPLPSFDLASATKAGATATFSTIAPHGFAAGDRVVVSGASIAGYNGAHEVASVPSETSFTTSLGSGGLNAATGGTAAKATAFTLTFSAYDGATSYEVQTSCGQFDVGTATSVELVLRDGCLRTPMDLVVLAKTSSTTEVAFTEITNAEITSGATIAIADTWHALSTMSVKYSNPTSSVTDVSLERFTPYVRGAAPVAANGTTTGDDVLMSFDTATPSVAWMRTVLRCPPGTSADCISSEAGIAQQQISERVDGTSTNYTFDIAPRLLPWVSAEYIPETRTLEVYLVGTGAFDVFEGNLRYVRFRGTEQIIYTWRVFSPFAQSVKFPTLPSSLPGDPTLRINDTQSAYQAYLCESDAFTGYREAIANVYDSLGTCETAATPTIKPQGGTLNRLSQWN